MSLMNNQPVAEVQGAKPRPVLLIGAKKSHLGCLISFELPMGFQNFVVINKILTLKFFFKKMTKSKENTIPINLIKIVNIC